MANRTIDRKKTIAARSQSARVGAKSAGSGATDPAIDVEEQTGLQAGSAALAEEDEMAESEDFEREDEEEAEESDSEAEETEDEDEEESRALEKPVERRVAKRERRESSVAVNPQDYAIRKSAGSRLPDNTLIRFVRSSYRELLMVTWPTRRETWNWSLVVVGVCVVVATLLGSADLGLSKFVEWWISLAH